MGLVRQELAALPLAERVQRWRDKPFLQCDTPAATWTILSDQFFKDDFELNLGSLGAYYAQMPHTLYGENTIKVVPVGEIRQEWAIPGIYYFHCVLHEQRSLLPELGVRVYCALLF